MTYRSCVLLNKKTFIYLFTAFYGYIACLSYIQLKKHIRLFVLNILLLDQ